MEVSYLLFVDETLIFCEPYKDQMMYLNWILISNICVEDQPRKKMG